MKVKENSGFTVIELLVAMALGLIILAGLFRTFKVQHDTFVVQDQVAVMQQNLRAAMYIITRDLQMAGWYSNFDRNNRTITLGDLPNKTGRPLLFSANNGEGGTINAGTDALVIIKAAQGSGGTITGNLEAGPTGIDAGIISLAGLNPTSSKYGLLVKNDLRTADFFELNAVSGQPSWSLAENYLSGDTVFRTDIIVYKIKNDATGLPILYRDNLGNAIFDQAVAENIENLQVRYQFTNGTWQNALAVGTPSQMVRAVEVTLVGRTAFPQRGFRDSETYTFADVSYTPNDNFRRKVLSTTVKTRNVGL